MNTTWRAAAGIDESMSTAARPRRASAYGYRHGAVGELIQGTGLVRLCERAGLRRPSQQSGFYLDDLAGYAYSGNQTAAQILIPAQQRTATAANGSQPSSSAREGGYRSDIYAPAQASITPFGRRRSPNVHTRQRVQRIRRAVAQPHVDAADTNSLSTPSAADLGGYIGLGTRERSTRDPGWAAARVCFCDTPADNRGLCRSTRQFLYRVGASRRTTAQSSAPGPQPTSRADQVYLR